jgi:hypothetical protein
MHALRAACPDRCRVIRPKLSLDERQHVADLLRVTGRERSSRWRQVAEVRRLLGDAETALDEIEG